MRVDSPAVHHLFRLGPIRRVWRRALPPPPPPYRAVRPRPIRLLLRLPRNVAIRIGPDLLALRRERIVGRVLLDRSARDCFTPTTDNPRPRVYDIHASCDAPPAGCIRLERLLAQTQRDLEVAEARLEKCRGRVESPAGSTAGPAWQEPVGYAYHWQPPAASQSGGVQVVHVPGVVRAYVSPAGRLVDVLM